MIPRTEFIQTYRAPTELGSEASGAGGADSLAQARLLLQGFANPNFAGVLSKASVALAKLQKGQSISASLRSELGEFHATAKSLQTQDIKFGQLAKALEIILKYSPRTSGKLLASPANEYEELLQLMQGFYKQWESVEETSLDPNSAYPGREKKIFRKVIRALDKLLEKTQAQSKLAQASSIVRDSVARFLELTELTPANKSEKNEVLKACLRSNMAAERHTRFFTNLIEQAELEEERDAGRILNSISAGLKTKPPSTPDLLKNLSDVNLELLYQMSMNTRSFFVRNNDDIQVTATKAKEESRIAQLEAILNQNKSSGQISTFARRYIDLEQERLRILEEGSTSTDQARFSQEVADYDTKAQKLEADYMKQATGPYISVAMPIVWMTQPKLSSWPIELLN
ncbi:MAG: hypothetical protein OXU45_02815 [Candidatus Melainabacteria bacterium]|nr:hypothetical protein [Candidatus Melainabacteria bacterium]